MAEMLLKRKPPVNDANMGDEKSEIFDRAYKLCREYLKGPWATITRKEFQLNVLGGGLTNKLYVCELPENKRDPNSKTPHTVLLRIYGLIIRDFIAQIQESVVFSILSERGIGPHLYAVFDGGRLEEYIKCRTLVTKDLPVPVLSHHIAKQMAIYHQLEMPVNKEPTCIMSKLELYLETVEHVQFDDKSKAHLLDSLLQGVNIDEEYKYLRNLIADTDSPIVFCHNDVQEGNLLHTGKEDAPIQMIDFEYSGYNYRGFDLGNHFCEWCYDYGHPEYPFYEYKLENYPSRQQQTLFIESYLKEYLSSSSISPTNEKWKVEFMIKEANRFALLSHFFWAMWSVVQAKMSDISFGYLEYAHVRMDSYFKQKAEIE